MWDRTITLSSCGKTFSVTGWQAGQSTRPICDQPTPSPHLLNSPYRPIITHSTHPLNPPHHHSPTHPTTYSTCLDNQAGRSVLPNSSDLCKSFSLAYSSAHRPPYNTHSPWLCPRLNNRIWDNLAITSGCDSSFSVNVAYWRKGYEQLVINPSIIHPYVYRNTHSTPLIMYLSTQTPP